MIYFIIFCPWIYSPLSYN